GDAARAPGERAYMARAAARLRKAGGLRRRGVGRAALLRPPVRGQVPLRARAPRRGRARVNARPLRRADAGCPEDRGLRRRLPRGRGRRLLLLELSAGVGLRVSPALVPARGV